MNDNEESKSKLSKLQSLKNRLDELTSKISINEQNDGTNTETKSEANKEPKIESLLDKVSDMERKTSQNTRMSFEEFVDERTLSSYDALGTKQMKIKVLEVSDEHPPVQWRFGDRVKVTKILVTIKHLDTQEVEEGEFDIESIERELAEKRHYTSTNRWIPSNEIKNGYVLGSRHVSLISDAIALDYIVF